MRSFALMSGASFLGSFILLRTRQPINPRSKATFDWRGFKDIRFTLTMSAIFVLDWAVMVPPAYITTYASTSGFYSLSPNILAILNSASILGRSLPGLAADKFGRFNIMIICSIMSALSIFGLWFNSASHPGLLICFALFYGFFSGSAYSLTPVCVAQLCRTDEFVTRYGTAYSLVSFATLAGVPISGSILDGQQGNRYLALISFCGAAYSVAAFLFIISRGVSHNWKIGSVF
jgi:predicted MFS family arabinose efflux permease